jgi:hypothetical protein
MAEEKRKKEKHELIIEFLEGQRDSLMKQMEAIDSPITSESSTREYELLIIRQKLYLIREQLSTIKLLVG